MPEQTPQHPDAGREPDTPNEPVAIVAHLAREYEAAVAGLDIDRLLALYDAEVVVYDLTSTWSYRGAPAWREAVREWFESVEQDQTNVAALSDLTVVGEGDLIAAHGRAHYGVGNESGEEIYAMDNRLTWLLRRGADGWRILHEHTSVPIDMETGRASL